MSTKAADAALPRRALYSPRETEHILAISHASFYRLVAAGRLEARKIGNKTVVPAESIETFLASLPRMGQGA